MNATHRDREPSTTQARLVAPAVLALMALLPQLGCAHQSNVARQDGMSRTLRAIDPDVFPRDVGPPSPDRANPAMPMIGADRREGPGGTSGPKGVRFDASRGATASPWAGFLAACWEAKIPPPRLCPAPAGPRPAAADAESDRWFGGLFAACEAARIAPPAAVPAGGPGGR